MILPERNLTLQFLPGNNSVEHALQYLTPSGMGVLVRMLIAFASRKYLLLRSRFPANPSSSARESKMDTRASAISLISLLEILRLDKSSPPDDLMGWSDKSLFPPKK